MIVRMQILCVGPGQSPFIHFVSFSILCVDFVLCVFLVKDACFLSYLV